MRQTKISFCLKKLGPHVLGVKKRAKGKKGERKRKEKEEKT